MLSKPRTKYNITADTLGVLVHAGEADVTLTTPRIIAMLLALAKRAILLRLVPYPR